MKKNPTRWSVFLSLKRKRDRLRFKEKTLHRVGFSDFRILPEIAAVKGLRRNDRYIGHIGSEKAKCSLLAGFRTNFENVANLTIFTAQNKTNSQDVKKARGKVFSILGPRRIPSQRNFLPPEMILIMQRFLAETS